MGVAFPKGTPPNPFTQGGPNAISGTHDWGHAQLCCGSVLPPNNGQCVAMCSGGGDPIAHIYQKTDGDPWGNGVQGYNTWWNWVFPTTCSPYTSGMCFVSWPGCPTGYTEMKTVGILMYSGSSYGASGAQYGTYPWWWNHPLLCCS